MKRLMLLLCVFLLGACSSGKNTTTNTQVDYSGSFNELKSSIDSVKLELNKQTQTTTDKLSNLQINKTTVYMSVPDSTGKQYKVKEVVVHAVKKDKEQVKQIEDLSATAYQIQCRIDSLTTLINQYTNKKEEVIELGWWDMHRDKVFAGGLVLILVLNYLISRKK